MSDLIQEFILEEIRKRAAIQEWFCERMLVDELCRGILEHHIGLRWMIELSPNVPTMTREVHNVEDGQPCEGCERFPSQ